MSTKRQRVHDSSDSDLATRAKKVEVDVKKKKHLEPDNHENQVEKGPSSTENVDPQAREEDVGGAGSDERKDAEGKSSPEGEVAEAGLKRSDGEQGVGEKQDLVSASSSVEVSVPERHSDGPISRSPNVRVNIDGTLTEADFFSMKTICSSEGTKRTIDT